jgi:hypothetical protein
VALAVLLALAAYARGATGQRIRAALWLLGLNPVTIVYIQPDDRRACLRFRDGSAGVYVLKLALGVGGGP